MHRSVFFLIPFIALTASAQDLTGIWRGHFKSDNVSRLLDAQGIEDRYKFEAQIGQDGKKFEGVTYSYKTTVFYGKASCSGTFNTQTGKVLLQETNILEVKTTGGTCIMTCFLQYSKVDDEEFLEGKYTGISISDSSFCGRGTVFLRKVSSSDFYKEPFLVQKEKEKEKEKKVSRPPTHKSVPAQPLTDAGRPPAKAPATPPAKKPAPKVPPASLVPQLPDKVQTDSPADLLVKPIPQPALPGVLTTRTNEVVRTIYTSAKEVTVRIYDNGTVDNDTVSVYFNNKLVVSRRRLTEKPIILKINLDDSTNLHELVMVAENLGEIPPNTSLMVVNTGDKQYEVRISSTEQKNAVVQFRLEKE